MFITIVGEINLLHVPTSSLIAGILRMLFSYMRVSSALSLLTQGAKAVSSYMKNLRDYLKKAQLVT
jgi:hypothetical protein